MKARLRKIGLYVAGALVLLMSSRWAWLVPVPKRWRPRLIARLFALLPSDQGER